MIFHFKSPVTSMHLMCLFVQFFRGRGWGWGGVVVAVCVFKLHEGVNVLIIYKGCVSLSEL